MGITQNLLEQRRAVSKAQKRAFARKINALIRKTGSLEKNKVDEMILLLRRAKADIQDEIFRLPKGKFKREMGVILKSEIDRLMREFQSRAGTKMVQAQDEFAKLGQDFTDEMIRSQGERPPILTLKPELIENAATRSIDLVRSLSQRQIGRASDIINRSVITGKSVFEVGQELSQEFNKGQAQMETIARTEILGIHSQVQFAELVEMERSLPGLGKQWIAVLDGRQRDSHGKRGAHLQIQPVNTPFDVGSDKLQFPRDPSGSAGEIINCRCTMVPEFSTVREDVEPLTLVEMPPVQVSRTRLEQEVARSVKKGFKNLR